MAIENTASQLVINTMPKKVFEHLKKTNQLKDNELYAVEGEDVEMKPLTNAEIEEILNNAV